MDAIHVSNLRKRFGDLEAVKGISFDVGTGEVFGFLGPNGAGKSTTINMLCTLATPTSGEASVAGYDIRKQRNDVRQAIGIVFQDPALDERLSAQENLRFHGWIYGVPTKELAERIDEVLALVELDDRRDHLVKTFSGGMKRRLEIARSLLHTPRVLFLDEPTIGLDPQTRAKIWNYLFEVKRRTGMTLFMTTHYMDEAEYCDRVAIMDHGEIVALDTPANLKARLGGDTVVLETGDNAKATQELQTTFEITPKPEGNHLTFVVPNGSTFLPELFQRLEVPIKQVSVRTPTLDDVFLQITGRAIRQQGAESPLARMGRRRRR